MTIITGTEYKANQGKYIKRAQEGERVIISSHGSYVELKPVPETDKDVVEHNNAKSFLATSARIDKAAREGKMLKFDTVEELRTHLASL
ncbi:MAG: type II toxin-antitoxin system prevent-host-death family antitoxin [Prevotella sp.]|jgi:prevent-host-death family protein|nr:type II toxin-antitoxin system prevent-host-death family antitoxin [Prevotella sp.]